MIIKNDFFIFGFLLRRNLSNEKKKTSRKKDDEIKI